MAENVKRFTATQMLFHLGLVEILRKRGEKERTAAAYARARQRFPGDARFALNTLEVCAALVAEEEQLPGSASVPARARNGERGGSPAPGSVGAADHHRGQFVTDEIVAREHDVFRGLDVRRRDHVGDFV